MFFKKPGELLEQLCTHKYQADRCRRMPDYLQTDKHADTCKHTTKRMILFRLMPGRDNNISSVCSVRLHSIASDGLPS